MTHMLQPMECSYHTLSGEHVPGDHVSIVSRFLWKSIRWIDDDDQQFCENPTNFLSGWWTQSLATGCRSIRRSRDEQIAAGWNWISTRPTGNRLAISQGPRDDSENVRTRRSDCNEIDWVQTAISPRLVSTFFYNVAAPSEFLKSLKMQW